LSAGPDRPATSRPQVADTEPSPPPSVRLAAASVRVRGDILLAIQDALTVVVCLVGMELLRYDGSVPGTQWNPLWRFAPALVGVGLASNWVWGLYGQIWRFASVLEARRVLLAGLTTTTISTAAVIVGPRYVPISVAVLAGLCYTMVIGASRFQARLFAFRRREVDHTRLRVAVVGAGEAAASLLRQMVDGRSGMVPVALLDDDPRTRGRSVFGVRVLGAIDRLPGVIESEQVQQVVLAVRSPSPELVRRVADICDRCDVPLRVLPDVTEYVRGSMTPQNLRAVRIEDLLGRAQVDTELADVRALLEGRRVLITGGGGSIGCEIARQVAACNPAELLLLDHDETHLYDAAAFLPEDTKQLLADIRDAAEVRRIMRAHRPEIIFHAAAHKHVPLLEEHPAEALRTNVVGTANLVSAAAEAGVLRFVFISTDKAVHPSSVMGATKRLAEFVVLGGAGGDMRCCAVRFGNVLGSRGSVIPTFMRQIQAGGPVTVTDPRMTRFFMSISEAVQLVLQAGAMAEGHEIFMLDMGEPVQIMELAQRMIRLAGRRAGTDIEIRLTGMRPGEKLAEELRTPDEATTPTSHPGIVRLASFAPTAKALEGGLTALRRLAAERHDRELKAELLRLSQARNAWSPTIDLDEVRVPGHEPVIDLTESATWSPSTT
jgi:FlaA1/EpsC-like NDP-sugar epimerase